MGNTCTYCEDLGDKVSKRIATNTNFRCPVYHSRCRWSQRGLYYKCELSALPGKLCHRFYIFTREVAHLLQFGVTINFLRAIITFIKK